ncbi:GGDEF domain-containing protein [Marinobacter gelidimuriae]|uniref:GGDEF domain-containing protein n=1 Tax=Marinobacter gelidimuriae TaxID=2739064 RepID=UPI0003761357|nr:GGDEF domain-containing protein [Marinobacter gelidimuriae]
MTETRLRTRTYGIAYLLTALFLLMLGLQNLRYGFYGLFFVALAMAVLAGSGLAYTIMNRRQQLTAKGHFIVLCTLNGAVLATSAASQSPIASHWAMPLLALNLLILPAREGLGLSLLLLVLMTLLLMLKAGTTEALAAFGGMAMLLGTFALAVRRYSTMAQSADDLTIIDPLTGAHHGRFLDENLQQEISRAKVTGHPLSVIALDIDHADEVATLHSNDTLPALQRQIIQQLFEIIRAGDILYTLSESTLFLILPFTPEEGARVVAERIRRTIAERQWLPVDSSSVSIGCTTHMSADCESNALIERAHNGASQARKTGGNSVRFAPGFEAL